jgi:hypothetical protein
MNKLRKRLRLLPENVIIVLFLLSKETTTTQIDLLVAVHVMFYSTDKLSTTRKASYKKSSKGWYEHIHTPIPKRKPKCHSVGNAKYCV